MLRVELSGKQVTLGDSCEFSITAANSGVEYQVFLKHKDIYYLKPLSGWISGDKFHLFPEAPGKYWLILKWRSTSPEGESGYLEYPFVVIGDRDYSQTPQLVRLDHRTRYWTPNSWEAKLIRNHEAVALKKILRYVKSGWTIYDIGANLGFYSLNFSRAVGSKGIVYSFEANPVCIFFLQANFELNRLENGVIIPAGVFDHVGETQFCINYSSSLLGVIKKSSFYHSKMGHEIIVKGFDLDQFSELYGARNPNLVKIDVEGAEGFVIEGMKNTLEKYHPILMVEVHGKEAAQLTLPNIKRFGYRLLEVDGYEVDDLGGYLKAFPDKIIQIICIYP